MTVEVTILQSTGRRQATVALMIATAMQAFDSTIANVALPQLERDLGGGLSLGAWVITSYLCASAVMATLTGWFRRRFGARRAFAGAIALFVVASLLCSIAPSSAALIQFRVVQGAAAGIIQPLAQALLLDIYPTRLHGRMLAIWGSTIMAGPIMGPVLGGIITDFFSWRWIFLLNLPLGAIAMAGLGQIPASDEPGRETRIDGMGILLLVIGVGSLQLSVERSIGQTWPLSPEIMVEASIAFLALSAIAVRSMRSQFTLFRLEVFRNINFTTSVFYNFVVGALLFTTIVFLPSLSEGLLGYNATGAGLAISPRGIGTMATMLVVGYLIDKIDLRTLLVAGLAITAAGFELLAQMHYHGDALWLGAASAIQGIGVGLLFTPLSTLAFATLSAELRTDAAGLYCLLRQLGCATGVAVMTAVLQVKIHHAVGAIPEAGPVGGNTPSTLHNPAIFGAYIWCFRTLAIVTIAVIPGVLLFRVMRTDRATTRVA